MNHLQPIDMRCFAVVRDTAMSEMLEPIGWKLNPRTIDAMLRALAPEVIPTIEIKAGFQILGLPVDPTLGDEHLVCTSTSGPKRLLFR